MTKSDLLEGLLDIAVDNATEDLSKGVYAQWITPGRKTAALALIIEAEYMELVEMSGQFNVDDDEDFNLIKGYFEDHWEDALNGE